MSDPLASLPRRLRAALAPISIVALAVAATACGGDGRKPAEGFGDVPEHDYATDQPSGEGRPKKASGEGDAAPANTATGELARLGPDAQDQIKIALQRGDRKALNCVDVVPDTARGEGTVNVLFDGRRGKSTNVTVGTPWAGTAAEDCIKNSFKNEIILPFKGPPIEVPHVLTIPAKGK